MTAADPAAVTVAASVKRGRFGVSRLGPIERRNLRNGLLFVSPWLIGFLIFGVFPIIYTFYLSLTRYSGLKAPVFIGDQNYVRMFNDPQFWKAAYNTLYYTLLAVPIGVVVAMALAMAMNRKVREIAIYRAVFYLPSILPVFAISFIFIVLLNPGYGLVNYAMSAVGLPSPNWLGDPAYSKIALVLIAQLGAGQYALIFLASLRGIPKELYESAALDGAGHWQVFRRITLPLMTPVILFDIVIGISLGLQVFTSAYILTGGGRRAAGPDDSLLTFVYDIYRQAFSFGQMGYAAALSVMLFLISIVLAIAVFRWARGWVYYEAERP
jgi:multiple sugar transport system permease protein